MLRWLNRLSLRQRFLIAPLFSLTLLGVLMAAFFYESQRQNVLLMRIADRELTAFEVYSEVFTHLSAQHIAIYELLSDTSKMTEETLYDNAKDRLYAIHTAVRDVEEALPPAASGTQSEAAALREKAIAQTRVYHRAVTSAVEMATVNLALAPSHLKVANDRFIDMNRAFTQLLNAQRQSLLFEVNTRVTHNKVTDIAFALVGTCGAVLVLILSLVLSRVLSRGVEMSDMPRQLDDHPDKRGPLRLRGEFDQNTARNQRTEKVA